MPISDLVSLLKGRAQRSWRMETGKLNTHVSGDCHRGTVGILGEGDDTGDGGVTLEDCDCLKVRAIMYGSSSG